MFASIGLLVSIVNSIADPDQTCTWISQLQYGFQTDRIPRDKFAKSNMGYVSSPTQPSAADDF